MILLFVLFLTGCMSTPSYEESLQNWVGVSRDSLYNTWGEPAASEFITPTQQLVTYFQLDPQSSNENNDDYMENQVRYQVMSDSQYGADEDNNSYFCRTSFTITDGIVTDFSFEGDACGFPAN